MTRQRRKIAHAFGASIGALIASASLASCTQILDLDHEYGLAESGDGDGLVCGEGQTRCGDACVDLASDPGHCGACGHDCGGGACAQHLCSAMQLASTAAPAKGLVVSADLACWASAGEIACAGDGAPWIVASDVDAGPLAIDGAYVYWAEPKKGLVRKAALDGSGAAPMTLVDGLTNPTTVAVDDQHVFFIHGITGNIEDDDADEANTGVISRIDKLGKSKVEDVVKAQWRPTSLLVTSSGLFYASRTKKENGHWKGDIRAVKKGKAAAQPLTNEVFVPQNLAFSEGALFWTDDVAGQLWSIDFNVPGSDRGGNSAPDVLASGLTTPGLAVADETHVYVVSNPAADILRVDRESGEIFVLVHGELAVSALAQDDRFVYWASGKNGGAVSRIAK